MSEKIKRVIIEKGWFWSAGNRYWWTGDGHAKEGVGIHASVLSANDKLHVTVQGVNYELDTKEAIAFVRKYKATYTMPRGTIVGVVSKSLLKEANPAI